jgi:hypothetical protein
MLIGPQGIVLTAKTRKQHLTTWTPKNVGFEEITNLDLRRNQEMGCQTSQVMGTCSHLATTITTTSTTTANSKVKKWPCHGREECVHGLCVMHDGQQ